MALNINGTTGISGIDGSASAPVFTGTDSNTGVSFGTDIVNVNTGGSTRLHVDASGRIGVGTTSPDKPFEIRSETASHEIFAINRPASVTAALYMGNDSSNNAIIASNNAALKFGRDFSGTYTNYMQIDSDGHFKIHNPNRVTVGTTSGDEGACFQYNASLGTCLFLSKTDNFNLMQNRNSSGNITQYRRNGLVKGQVDINATRVAYQTTSDYRLKENVATLSNGITRLKDLKPCRFNFKDDAGNTIDGFLAHELQVVVPEAVSGTKDQVDSDNNPYYQGADNSFIVPLLTAALQEAVGKIETLETKVAALEAA